MRTVAARVTQVDDPGTSPRAALERRAQLYAMVRAFFAHRSVLEVETPILSGAGNTEPNIEGFSTVFSGHVDAGGRERWLRTSPEYSLKRLLASGTGDCYELGRVFRNGEAGARHNPEFTMLEWYRVGWDHRRLARETCDLVVAAMATVARPVAVLELRYAELFATQLGIDPHRATLEELRTALCQWVRKEIGPIAVPDALQFAPGLPKTRSGKIMRRILRKIAEGEVSSLGDTSTLADPAVVEDLVANRVG